MLKGSSCSHCINLHRSCRRHHLPDFQECGKACQCNSLSQCIHWSCVGRPASGVEHAKRLSLSSICLQATLLPTPKHTQYTLASDANGCSVCKDVQTDNAWHDGHQAHHCGLNMLATAATSPTMPAALLEPSTAIMPAALVALNICRCSKHRNGSFALAPNKLRSTAVKMLSLLSLQIICNADDLFYASRHR